MRSRPTRVRLQALSIDQIDGRGRDLAGGYA
jgi:hypothetical protein